MTNRNWGARVGEAIIGSLGRGGGGQFQRVGAGGGEKPPAAGGKPAAAGQPPAQGAAPAAQPPKGADEMAAFLGEAGLDPQLAEALGEYLSGQTAEDPADREDIALNSEAAAALAALGLVTIREGQEGQPNQEIDLSEQGQAMLAAMQAGDKAGTAAAISGQPAEGEGQPPAPGEQPPGGAPPLDPKAEEKKKGGGGGGGGGGAKPPEAAADPAQARAKTAQEVGLDPQQAESLAAAAQGGTDPQQASPLVEQGLVGPDGQATPAGRQALAALEKGDARAYYAAVQRAQELATRQKERAGLEAARQQAAQGRQASANAARVDAANIVAGRDQRQLALARQLGARSAGDILDDMLEAAIAAYDEGIAELEAEIAGEQITTAQAPIGAVKSVDPAHGRITVRGIVYGGRDLVGDTFTPETDLGRGRSFKGMPVYYDHALRGIKSQIGEVVEAFDDDGGIDFEVELDRRHRYAGEVLKLAEAGALGGSTGALSHLIVRRGGQIKRWIAGELSLTPTPAEPRTRAAAKKTIDARPQAGPQAPSGATGAAAQRRPYILIIERKTPQ